MYHLTSRAFLAALFAGLVLAGPLTLTSSSAQATRTSRSAAPVVKLSVAHLIVSPSGHTLYVLTADGKTKSTCYQQCAHIWPPMLVAKGATPPAHMSGIPGTFGVTVRTDGTHQLTYDGAPLYRFLLDKAAGTIKGQGIFNFGGFWWAVVAGGSQ
jgi:predicted lipoprotein with Yx(FWY)xxD motif